MKYWYVIGGIAGTAAVIRYRKAIWQKLTNLFPNAEEAEANNAAEVEHEPAEDLPLPEVSEDKTSQPVALKPQAVNSPEQPHLSSANKLMLLLKLGKMLKIHPKQHDPQSRTHEQTALSDSRASQEKPHLVELDRQLAEAKAKLALAEIGRAKAVAAAKAKADEAAKRAEEAGKRVEEAGKRVEEAAKRVEALDRGIEESRRRLNQAEEEARLELAQKRQELEELRARGEAELAEGQARTNALRQTYRGLLVESWRAGWRIRIGEDGQAIFYMPDPNADEKHTLNRPYTRSDEKRNGR